MREGESPGTLLCPRARSSMPGAFPTDTGWVCLLVGPQTEAHHYPHGVFPTFFLSTSPLSVQPRAGCLSGQSQSPACACSSAQTNRCRSAPAMDRKGCSPFCLCTPLLPPAPRASHPWLFCPPHAAPARLEVHSLGASSIAGGSVLQPIGDAPKAGCDIWERFSCLVHIANMPQAAAPAHRSSSRHQGHCCPQGSKPGRIQARLGAKILTLG